MPPESRDDTSYFFNLAIQQYSDINLFFYLDKCEYSHLKSLCVGIKNNHFITRSPIAQVDAHPIVWGTEVSGYFTVRDLKPEPCHFRSRLVRIYNGPPDSLFLVFPLPRFIDHNQRRFSKRVNIDPELAKTLTVWYGQLLGGDSETLPQLRWYQLESRHGDLAELSANGMRLDFPEKSPIVEKMTVNDEILLRGNFGSPVKPVEIMVLGNIVRIMPKPETEGIVSVGCHFLSWRRADAPPNQAWFHADSHEGIGLIAQWLSRTFKAIRN